MHVFTLLPLALLACLPETFTCPMYATDAAPLGDGMVARAASTDFSTWSPAGPDDVRSPCPALNSLANHGILPHSGKGITFGILKDALFNGLNVGADFSLGIFTSATVLGATSTGPSGIFFDLDMLNKHNALEHDLSLSRADINNGGDDHTFNSTIFDAYMKAYAGQNATTFASAGKARIACVTAEKPVNANLDFGLRQQVLSMIETALLINSLNGYNTGIVPVSWIRILFGEFSLSWPTRKMDRSLTQGAMF